MIRGTSIPLEICSGFGPDAEPLICPEVYFAEALHTFDKLTAETGVARDVGHQAATRGLSGVDTKS